MVSKCPFHDENNPSFSVNLDTGYWKCFSCGRGGGIKKLLYALGISYDTSSLSLIGKKRKKKTNDDRIPISVLASYEFIPKRLVRSGFKRETLEFFNIGFDLNNRMITFPIFDKDSNLVGISGRRVSDTPYGKYKMYTTSELGDIIDESYSCEKSNHLWNLNNVKNSPSVIIVEGFKACMYIWQCGFKNVVALMTSTISNKQLVLFKRLFTNYILFLDNDVPGIKGTAAAVEKLGFYNTRIAQYPIITFEGDGKSPDDLTFEELTRSLNRTLTLTQWKGKINESKKSRKSR